MQMKTGISYFGVRDPDHVKKDVNEIADLGFTHILHTMSEADLWYYPETMAEIVSISKKAGLKVYVNPWGVGRVFGGEAFSELAIRNPAQAQQSNQGRAVVASCPNHPKFRDYMRNWIDVVTAMEIETVFWDEPHFYFEKNNPELWCCRCETCQKIFRKEFKHVMPNSLTESVQEFRNTSILKFLSEMTQLVHDKGKRNSVCLLPLSFNSGVENWDAVAELKNVDEIGTDPYWERGTQPPEIAKSYHQHSKKIVSIAKKYGKEPQMWIKNYQIEKNGENAVADATYAAYNEGIRNIFAWSFKGNKNLSWLRSDDWKKVWNTQIEAFGECHEKAIMNEMIQALNT